MVKAKASDKCVAVVGGGFAGLTAALRLCKKGRRVTLFERAPVLGGLAAGFKEPGWNWSLEKYYHHWFTSDACVQSLARELGIESKLMFKRPLTVIEDSTGRFRAIDSAIALLRYPDMSLMSRLRMGASLAYLKMSSNWRQFEKLTAKEWCEKAMGTEGFEAIWKPLLIGKFGDHAFDVNMAWLWARLKSRTPALGTFEGGFQAFVEAIAAELRRLECEIVVNCGELSFEKSNVSPHFVERAGACFDAVLVAASPTALKSVFRTLSPAKKTTPSLGAQVVVLMLRKSLSPNGGPYWYSLRKGHGKPFLALIDHAQFVPAEHFGGEHPVYVADYVDTAGGDWLRTDEELVGLALSRIRTVAPHIDEGDVNKSWVFREAYAQPVPIRNASALIPSLEVEGTDGLFHASLAHVYPWDRGTNYAIELGEKAAAAVDCYLKKSVSI